MLKHCILAVGLIASLAANAAAQDAAAAIAAASKAMGADALKTIQYSGSGFDFALGQNGNPNLPWPRFIDKTYTRSLDFEKPASQMERTRLQGENPPRGGGGQPLRGEQKQNQVVIVSANTPWAQEADILVTPYGFLKAAAAGGATAKTETVGGKRFTVVSFTAKNKAPVHGYINDQNMVERVDTWLDNAVLGDMLFESMYTEYKDFAGVKFPTKILQKQGGHPTLDLTITEVKPNLPLNIQPAQGGGGGGGGQQAAGVPSEKLGEGIYVVTGGYASLVVEFTDHIVVFEGAQTEARGMAVIAETKKLIPNKPIRYVVNTHHHFDHSSGLRAFVAEGATIITHEVNKAFYEKAYAAPRTINPDAAAKAKATPKFETMTEKKVLTDGKQTVELHRMHTGHHDGMIMAYVPSLKLLYQADGYNATAEPTPTLVPPSVYHVAVLDNVKRLGLQVDRVIPVHYPPNNRKIDMKEIMNAVGQAAPSTN
jgi:glyoxylase-like metal-dependent hydrolase (beta-lactamase superfamily II)